MQTVTFKSGNKEQTVTVASQNIWEIEGKKRAYFDLKTTGDVRKGIFQLYEIIEGSTKDKTVSVNNRIFGYQAGGLVNSNQKKKAVEEAVENLAAQI